MNHLNSFKNYLLQQKVSSLTIKNYLNDLKLFINWFEEQFKTNFNPEFIDQNLINLYKKDKEKNLSFISLKRHLASLRKFIKFLNESGFSLPVNIFVNKEENNKLDNYLNEFKNFLYTSGSAKLTIKNYIADIQSFINWCNETLINKSEYLEQEKNIFGKITNLTVNEYKYRLITILHLSPRSINRKLSSIRKYLAFLVEKKIITEDKLTNNNLRENKISLDDIVNQLPNQPKGILSQIIHPVIRLEEKTAEIIVNSLESKGKINNIPQEFFNPQGVSIKNLSLPKKILHHLKHSRPLWYKRYHSYPGVNYFHQAILIIYCVILGIYIYNHLFQKTETQRVLSAGFIGGKLLSFKGKLLDTNGKPVIKNSNIRFAIYNDRSASGSALLWQEVVYNAKPDSEGEFNLTLGKSNPVYQNLSQDNPELYLGITVENNKEITPRERIPVPTFVADSEKLQNMLPITRTSNAKNSIMALDSAGNLVIDGKINPAFLVPNGQFSLSGNELHLATNLSSNGNIRLAPDGTGLISLERPLVNLNNSGIGIEVADKLIVNASDSAHAAFTLNNNFPGDIFAASAAGFTRFLIQSNGNVGIGTDTPTKRLDVAGSENLSGDLILAGAARAIYSQDQNPLNIGSQTTGNLLVQTAPESTITLASPTILTSGLSASGSANFLSNVAVYGTTNLNNLSTSGNLGIGTANPTARLEVQGNGLFYGDLNFQGKRTIAALNLNSLTLGDSNTGNLLINPAGEIGIGTVNPDFKFDTQDSQSATAAARIFNTNQSTQSGGLIIKLGNPSAATISADNRFISFETTGIGLAGAIQGNESNGIQLKTGGIADFAEYLTKSSDSLIPYGSLVCLDAKGLALACGSQSGRIVGVASSHPTVIGGSDLGDGSIATALIGQVETNVSDQNGPISPGDYITSSTLPGVGVKAIASGFVVGRALEPFQAGTGKIKVLVLPAWYDSRLALQDDGNAEIIRQSNDSLILNQNETQDSEFLIKNSFGQVINRFEIISKLITANLEAGLIKAKEITTDSLAVASNRITVAGKSLDNYLSDFILTSKFPLLSSDKMVSPLAEIDQIQTSLISPLASSSAIAVRLDNNQITFLNGKLATDSAVATIDRNGDASFAGNLTASSLHSDQAGFSTATVSGTLTADTIIAKQIAGLDQKIASSTSELLANNILNGQLTLKASLNIANAAGNLVTFEQGLVSLAPSTFSDLSLVGNFSLGDNFKISGNSINVIGDNLALQSLGQGGITFLSGLVSIDTNGNLIAQNIEAKNDLKVNGRLSTRLISPLPNQDLIINLANEVTYPSELKIENSSSSSILTVNRNGDLTASGSGSFNKLNLFAAPAYALSNSESVASASAGTATIYAYQKEVTVRSLLVKKDSLIYITPAAGSIQPVFLERQDPGNSFTVGLSTPVDHDTQFNFLIVN